MSSESEEAAQVPVALFAYSRPAELPRTLECLRNAGVQRLYVFSDGPRSEADASGVSAVREELRRIDWVEPTIIERAENLGLSRSIRTGLDLMFESHDVVIVIEDDVCIAPEFYDYARLALRHYDGEQSVAGITGLRYPFTRDALDRYPFDVFVSPRFSSWGWATWRERWRGFDFDPRSLRRRIAAAADFRPELAGADLPGMIHDAIVTESLTGSWDVACAANMALAGQHFVTPSWNMIENSGLAEGTHSSEAPPWELRWEREHRPSLDAIRFSPVVPDHDVLEAYLEFFDHPPGGGAVGRARSAAASWRSRRRLRKAWGRL